MGLGIYSDDQVLLTDLDRFRPFINGYQGGSHEELIYVRNTDVSRWYTNLVLSLVTTSVYDGNGELGASGISFKFIYGERRPTEAEWDVVASGESLNMPDIGTHGAGNVSTYHGVWVRVYVPGGSPAGINDSFTLRLTYLPRIVGA